MDKMLESQLFWGIISLFISALTIALAFSGKLSMNASGIFLAIAWLISIGGTYALIPSLHQSIHWILRSLITMFVASIFGIGLFYLDQWIGPKNTFCYFSLYQIDGKPVEENNKFQLGITVVGSPVEKVNYWISPWGVQPTTGKADDPYYSFDVRKSLIEIIHEGGRAWDRALPAGDYRIDFNTKNGNWYEHFQIYMEKGQIKERIKVSTKLDAGEVLYDSEIAK